MRNVQTGDICTFDMVEVQIRTGQGWEVVTEIASTTTSVDPELDSDEDDGIDFD